MQNEDGVLDLPSFKNVFLPHSSLPLTRKSTRGTNAGLLRAHLADLGRGGLRQEGRGGRGDGGRQRRRVLRGRPRDGDVLHRDAVRGDVVDLARRGHVHQVVGLHLDLVAGRQEGVEAHDEVGVAFEEL